MLDQQNYLAWPSLPAPSYHQNLRPTQFSTRWWQFFTPAMLQLLKQGQHIPPNMQREQTALVKGSLKAALQLLAQRYRKTCLLGVTDSLLNRPQQERVIRKSLRQPWNFSVSSQEKWHNTWGQRKEKEGHPWKNVVRYVTCLTHCAAFPGRQKKGTETSVKSNW